MIAEHGKRGRVGATVLGLTLLLQACSVAVGARIPGPASEAREARGIPPGHMPPPGECRVWYPGEPPGQQPPPGPCEDLRLELTDGTWLLYRPDREARVYRVD